MMDIFNNELIYGDVIITPLKEYNTYLKFAFNMFIKELGDNKYLATRLLEEGKMSPIRTFKVECIKIPNKKKIKSTYAKSYIINKDRYKDKYGDKN